MAVCMGYDERSLARGSGRNGPAVAFASQAAVSKTLLSLYTPTSALIRDNSVTAPSDPAGGEAVSVGTVGKTFPSH